MTVEDTPNALGGTEGNYSNLRDEIGNGGNINLSRSNYIYVSGDGDTIVITSPGVIDGKGAVIDMAGAYIQAFVVSADNVTIKNLTIQNVNTYGEGGAFYVNGSSNVTITNCKFINNNAQDGGAIYFNAANVIVSDCIFNNNSAFFNGGAIFINCTILLQQNVFLLTTMPQVMEEIVVKVVLSVFMDVYSHILTIVNSPTTLPPLEILK